ncbi:Pre-rRNA-processing protein ipi3 [Tulasnella sp. 408]|nr:Pre-rRNA-processing protein ipi3 [Tulasnella sp. 408]
MKVRELVCCSIAPPSAALGMGNIALYDIQTGSQLASFKQTSAPIHSTAIVETKSQQGGLILASQPDKAILNVYSFQKEQLHLKIVLPEKLTCIATDAEGHYCAGGTANGRIYLWELWDISSTTLLATFIFPQPITVLAFDLTERSLFAASQDGSIHQINLFRQRKNRMGHNTGSIEAVAGMEEGGAMRIDDEEVLRGTLPPYDLLADHRFFMDQQSGATAESTQSLQSRITELESELASMKQNLAKAKGLNDAMWETVVSSVLGSENPRAGEEEEVETRKPKKARANGK